MKRHRPRHPKLGIWLVASLLYTGAPLSARLPQTAEAGPVAAKPRMNVLFLIADDLNTRMNVTGFKEVRTPNLDKLAASGVNFANAYSQFPWCGPSRASFLTGLRPDTIKVYNLQTKFRDNVPNVVTLPQYFRENGYRSVRVGKIFHQGVPGDIGTSGPDDPQSWDEVVNPKGRDKINERDGRLTFVTPVADRAPLGGAMTYLADEGTDEEQTDGIVASETIRLLEENRGRPFFLAAGFYRPHVPEIAPKKYFDMYPLEKISWKPATQAELDNVNPLARGGRGYPRDKLSVEGQREFVRSYYAATTFMDAQVGRVLDSLKRLGLDKNTIVVFTSDHGYALGEHGQYMKQMLWEPVARVPLIISAPGLDGKRLTSRRMVEMIDIYPTLADLAGLPPPPEVEGRSLKPLISNPAAKGWNDVAHSQVTGGRSVRVSGWRYTEWHDGEGGAELYDEKRDPRELNNLASQPKYAKLVARLKAMMPKLSSGRQSAGSGKGE